MVSSTAVVATVLGVAAPLLPPYAPATHAQHRPDSSPVRGWSMSLEGGVANDRGQQFKGTRRFDTVGVTWSSPTVPDVQVRTRSHGRWSPWRAVDPLTDNATEPLWVGGSHGVTVRVRNGWQPGLELVLVDAGNRPSDTRTSQKATSYAGRTTVRSTGSGPPMPRVYRRKRWGANESWRNGDPYYTSRIKQAHVHHTASSSDYTRADVPGIIRSMYWYHTKQLGWSDIGYNFLIDKFGRIWEGRYGGVRRKVRGAHTLGFNHASFGIASISNHERAPARKYMVRSLVWLTAWKLAANDRRPAGRTWIWSQGSDRYPAGTRVRLPVIDGHRDTNYTACPGERLYDRLPRIRQRVQNRVDNWS